MLGIKKSSDNKIAGDENKENKMLKEEMQTITWMQLFLHTSSNTNYGTDYLANDTKFISFVMRCADCGIGGQRLLDLAVQYVKENREFWV